MFSRADSADPEVAAKVVVYTIQGVVGVGKDLVEVFLQAVREDVVVSMVAELEPVINVSLVDSLFDWVERIVDDGDEEGGKGMKDMLMTITSLHDLGWYLPAPVPQHCAHACAPSHQDQTCRLPERSRHWRYREPCPPPLTTGTFASARTLVASGDAHLSVKKLGPRSRFSSAATDSSLATTSLSTDQSDYSDLPGFGKPWHIGGLAQVEQRSGQLGIGIGEAAEIDDHEKSE
ncbi:hypothetical protein BCR44DRAFT_54669 [Catenaria anguillulae PL171]|uniref:Uncharacterized protein n=1 Tax=Catenaria anguillulae PL171 TaxID=765915 RepID=A0A1Y2HB74_9FUNG|nr:hypothetical protein BCR44DRAFT_54669 [Catenaria anguillulae PL171]